MDLIVEDSKTNYSLKSHMITPLSLVLLLCQETLSLRDYYD